MEDRQMENRPDPQEQPRKAWHAPVIRWLDVRETHHGLSGGYDGGTSGSSVS